MSAIKIDTCDLNILQNIQTKKPKKKNKSFMFKKRNTLMKIENGNKLIASKNEFNLNRYQDQIYKSSTYKNNVLNDQDIEDYCAHNLS